VFAMTASFNTLNLPSHIHIERAGRGDGGTPMAALVCEVCSGEEETADTPQALRDLATRFVRGHMECTPAGVDED
jgi:hypothetical protein